MDSNGQVLGDEDKGQRQEQKIEVKNEVRKDGQKVEIREKKKEEIKDRIEIKSGEKKREFESKGIKIKMEQKNGELKIKAKNEVTGEETELEAKIERKERPEPKEFREKEELAEPVEPQEIQERPENETEIMRVREREDKNEVRINSRNGGFVIDRNNVGASTNFPLTVDSQTNTLTVTTPSGEKQVTTLPDQAVRNMLMSKVIDTVNGQNAANFSSEVKMTQKSDGTLVYEVVGERQKKLFGLMPLKFKKTAVVSVETGALVETKESFSDKLLELISF